MRKRRLKWSISMISLITLLPSINLFALNENSSLQLTDIESIESSQNDMQRNSDLIGTSFSDINMAPYSIYYSNQKGRIFENINNDKLTGYYIDADSDNTDKGESYADVNFKYKIDIFQNYKNYLFGNISQYRYWDEILLNVNNSNENLQWSFKSNKGEKGSKFKLLNLDISKLSFYDLNRSFFVSNYLNEVNYEKADFSKINSKTKVELRNDELIVSVIAYIYAKEADAAFSAKWIRSKVEYIEPLITKFNLFMPYSQYDLNQFSAIFKDTLTKPIFIENSNSPIIFDYIDSSNNATIGDNEKYVNDIFQKRVNSFINNNYIKQNRLGNLIVNNQLDTNIADIKLHVDPSKRGKPGSQIVQAKLILKNNRKFVDYTLFCNR